MWRPSTALKVAVPLLPRCRQEKTKHVLSGGITILAGNVYSSYVIFIHLDWFSAFCPSEDIVTNRIIYLSKNLVRIDLGTSALEHPIL